MDANAWRTNALLGEKKSFLLSFDSEVRSSRFFLVYILENREVVTYHLH